MNKTRPIITARIPWARIQLPEGGTVCLHALRFGSGRERIVVLAGLHGDEVTPLYVLERVIASGSEIDGWTVDVIPMINWLGLLLGSRGWPLGGENLNRSPGAAREQTTGRVLISRLIDFISGADLVVDLHNWECPTALMGISYAAEPTIDDPGIRMLTALGCEYIWQAGRERGLEKTIGGLLSSRNVSYCALEFPPPWLIDSSSIEELARRFLNFLTNTSVIECLPPIGGRASVCSTGAGLFDPLSKPGEKVINHEPIARLISASSLETAEELRSPADGVLLHIESRRFVNGGQIIAYVGTGN